LKITISYPNGQMTRDWFETDYFCPNCGELEVWVQWAKGHEYLGVTYACTACDHLFSLPQGTFKPESDHSLAQVTAKIREEAAK
jgi:predicted RNA-binding Zn-ribbon protein involved in translation (DUF1610 family)